MTILVVGGAGFVGSNLVQHTYMINRRIEMGVDATWELTATHPGHYVIPAPTAFVNGKKVTLKVAL